MALSDSARGRERGDRDEHIFLAHDQIGGVERSQLEAVTVGDGVGGAGLDTVAAEDAAVVVDVVGFGVAFAGRDALLGGIVGCLDEDAVGWAGGGAEETGDAFFESVFVALQLVSATEARLEDGSAQRTWTVGVVFDFRGLKHLPECDAHAFGDSGRVANDRHGFSIRWMACRMPGQKTLCEAGYKCFGEIRRE